MESWQAFDLYNPTEEHKMLREMVAGFVADNVEPQAHEYDKKEEFNLELFKSLGELGLLGLTVPEEFGGSGMDATAVAIVHEELSASDPGFCLAYLAHSLLCLNNIAVNGSQEQKQKYLPDLCSGKTVGCMAMSEPDAGTDVLGMATTAELKGSEYIVNGRKMWITNGTIDEKNTSADVVLLYGLSSAKDEKPKVSTFIIDKTCDGYEVGQKIKDKLGMRASNTAELVFQDCKVPKENLVGEEGDSMHHMMRNLEIERLGLAAMSLGMARRSIDIMSKYAQERKAFKQPINRFGQIQQFIGDSYAEYNAARAYVYETARKLDLYQESNSRLDSDGVKLFAGAMAKRVADRAIQVLGGYGYVAEYVVERLWRDAKLIEIGGGTNEAHQKNITKDLAKR